MQSLAQPAHTQNYRPSRSDVPGTSCWRRPDGLKPLPGGEGEENSGSREQETPNRLSSPTAAQYRGRSNYLTALDAALRTSFIASGCISTTIHRLKDAIDARSATPAAFTSRWANTTTDLRLANMRIHENMQMVRSLPPQQLERGAKRTSTTVPAIQRAAHAYRRHLRLRDLSIHMDEGRSSRLQGQSMRIDSLDWECYAYT